tara:strand:- start:526 stop:708 length:183 start_codon:yes stop_codon:yes gene_type:complete
VWYVPDLSIGEKSGKKIGMVSSIVQNDALGRVIYKNERYELFYEIKILFSVLFISNFCYG